MFFEKIKTSLNLFIKPKYCIAQGRVWQKGLLAGQNLIQTLQSPSLKASLLGAH